MPSGNMNISNAKSDGEQRLTNSDIPIRCLLTKIAGQDMLQIFIPRKESADKTTKLICRINTRISSDVEIGILKFTLSS